MADYTDILAGYLRDYVNRLQELIFHPFGSQSSPWNQSRHLQQQAQCLKALQDLKRQMSDWTGKAVSQAIRQGDLGAVQMMKQMNIVIPAEADSLQPIFSIVDRRTLDVLARDAWADVQRAADSTHAVATNLLRKVSASNLTPKEVNEAIAKGVLSGDKAQLIRDIRAQLRNVKEGKITVPAKDGPRVYDADDYARLVANTRLREASRLARHERLRESGIDLVIIVGYKSKNPCSFALGKVYSLSGNDPDHPALSSVPAAWRLFHPNCSKSTAPFVPGMQPKEVLEKLKTDPDDPALKLTDPKKAERAFKDLQGIQSVETRLDSSVRDIRSRAQAAGYEPPSYSPTKQEAKDYAESVGFSPNPKTFYTRESADAWGERTFRQLADLLPKIQKEAISEYQSPKFKEMNAIAQGLDYYRDSNSNKTIKIPKEDIPNIQKKVDQAVLAFQDSSLPNAVVSFRGTSASYYGLTPKKISQKLVGLEIASKSFTSSSLLLEKGKEFSSKLDDHIIMEIRSPKGTNALFINTITGKNSRELELAFPPGTRFKVLEVTRKNLGSDGRLIPYLILEVIQ